MLNYNIINSMRNSTVSINHINKSYRDDRYLLMLLARPEDSTLSNLLIIPVYSICSNFIVYLVPQTGVPSIKKVGRYVSKGFVFLTKMCLLS